MATDWENWWASYSRSHPGAAINAETRDKFRAWQAARAGQAAPAPAAPAPPPTPEYQPPAPKPYTPPAFDVNYRDAEAQTDLSNLKAKYDTQRLNAQSAYGTWLTENYGAEAAVPIKDANGKITGWTFDTNKRGGKFLQIDDSEREGLRGSINSAAARGMSRSGHRYVADGRVRTAATNQRTDLQNAQNRAWQDMDAAVTGANTDEALQNQEIVKAANRRRLDQYNSQYGMGS